MRFSKPLLEMKDALVTFEIHDCWDNDELFAEFANTEYSDKETQKESTEEDTEADTEADIEKEVEKNMSQETTAEATEETSEERAEKRKQRNRESAALSRKRKKDYVTRVEIENEILIEEMKRMDAARC